MTGLRIKELQYQGALRLAGLGISDPARDTRILLAYAIEMEPSQLISKGDDEVTLSQQDRFEQLVTLRAKGRPVHRIIGRRMFFGRQFKFDSHCLEPRPETELLVERVLEDVAQDRASVFAEVGVGSGVISVSLLCELLKVHAVATDISVGALEASRNNARQFGVDDRLSLIQTDCLKGIDQRFDFVVSNPPYIATGELTDLPREIREHDPPAALDGGTDGLEFYRKLLVKTPTWLRPGGRLYLETGHGQHEALIDIAEKNGWGIVSTHLDLSGLERIVVFEGCFN